MFRYGAETTRLRDIMARYDHQNLDLLVARRFNLALAVCLAVSGSLQVLFIAGFSSGSRTFCQFSSHANSTKVGSPWFPYHIHEQKRSHEPCPWVSWALSRQRFDGLNLQTLICWQYLQNLQFWGPHILDAFGHLLVSNFRVVHGKTLRRFL